MSEMTEIQISPAARRMKLSEVCSKAFQPEGRRFKSCLRNQTKARNHVVPSFFYFYSLIVYFDLWSLFGRYDGKDACFMMSIIIGAI